MKVSRRVDAITALQRLSRPKLPVVATPLSGEAWIAPTFENSWQNYETDGLFEEAGYRLGRDGRVHLRGLVKRTLATGLVAIFTLPAGYRPSAQKVYLVPGVMNAADHGRVDVGANGSVSFFGDGVNKVEYLSLAAISFYPD